MGTCSSCNRKECGNCLQCHNKNCKSYSPSYDPRGQCGKNVPIETKKSFDIAWELMKSEK